jgi:hypothetical protein
MKAQLAMRLLAEQMGWDDNNHVGKEFAWLNLMAEYKYDHYQGYSPGARFFVNLLLWIAQFPQQYKEQAYSFVRDKLVYISQREMHNLVSLTMPKILLGIRKAIAMERGMPFYLTWSNNEAEARVNEMSLRTLYIGLSDGAKIDVFRRENEGVVSNEQVVAVTEISDKKWEKLVKELGIRLHAEGMPTSSPIFERICLIDDFTASGSSVIRNEEGTWKGKIPTFLDQNSERVGRHILSNCIIQIHHYIGSAQARETIENLLADYQKEKSEFRFRFEITFSMILSKDIVIDNQSPIELVALLKDCYGKSCQSTHTGEDIWFGYKQCGLPVILDHNTPNNSIALLWASSHKPNDKDDKHVMKPLFPRKQRHIDHGQSI